jgi:type I restriction enzyme S subunit
MEVRPGYKQTEVGVIPEEWRVETIGRLIEERFIVGHLDGNHGELYPRSHEFKPHGVPYIGANDFDEDFVSFERCKFLTKERAAQFRKGVAKDGDVLFAHNATVGPVALLRTKEPFVILSTTATYFRCNPEKLSNSYLKGALQSDRFVKQYQAVMAQSTRFQVPITAQRKLSLVIPPPDEQRAIAGALSDVDALIGGLDQLIAKKRDLKQAAMQQLLTGQTRLPGFCGEWAVKKLGDCLLSRPDYGINAAAVPFSDKLPGYIRITDISEHGRFCPDPPVSVKAASADQFYLQEGDVVFARTGASVGKSYLYNPLDGPLVFAGFLIRVCPNPDVLVPAFLAGFAATRAYWNWVRLMSMRSGQPGINGNEYAQLPLSLPSVPEQTAIAEVLSDLDAELAALEQRRDKTRALKQSMMQELLTGKTRLPVQL